MQVNTVQNHIKLYGLKMDYEHNQANKKQETFLSLPSYLSSKISIPLPNTTCRTNQYITATVGEMLSSLVTEEKHHNVASLQLVSSWS